MPNQRAIAAAAGVTQAAVSKALRGDRTISEHTRKRIEEVARKLGYRPNSYVSTLMSHIRAGRPLQDKGCIGFLVDAKSEKHWFGHAGGYAYRLQCQGARRRAEELGFATELFYLHDAAYGGKRIERILQARGICGLALMPSPASARGSEVALDWDRYALAAISYLWENLSVDRVSTHHRHNVEMAFRQVVDRGYERVGMCLPPEAVEGVDNSWRERFLLWRERTPPKHRIPLFVGKPGITPRERFFSWLKKWKPEVLVCLIGHEKEWLDELGLAVPEDLAMVCVNRRPGSAFSGVEENLERIGAAVVDAVASHIERNEFGPTPHPKLILIEGSWKEGRTLPAMRKAKTARRRNPSSRSPGR